MGVATVVCPGCGATIPARNTRFGWWYRCDPCDRSVGCHPDTQTPLGIMADQPTRKARIAAHDAFDTIWKSGAVSRSKAYKLLRKHLRLNKDDCHMGSFDTAQCARVERWAAMFKQRTRE